MIVYFIFLVYAVYVFWLSINWAQRPKNKKYSIDPIKVSVVIPFRNEEKYLSRVVESLLKQDYPSEFMHIYLVDDKSTDASTSIAKGYSKAQMNVFYLRTDENEGKKGAITQVVDITDAEIISVLDADVEVRNEWLSHLVGFYQSEGFDYLAMPVNFYRKSGLFQRLQELEFLTLIASAASSLFGGKALMSNGANHAFRKSSFEKIGGYQGNLHIASGDDLFLMFEMEKDNDLKVKYFLDKSVIACTEPTPDFSSFFYQRIRWASKARYYTSLYAVSVSWLILIANITLIVVLVYSLFSGDLKMFLFPLLIKFLVDFIFISSPLSYFDRNNLLPYTIPLTIIYPWYIFVIGILSFFYRPKWKGRNIIHKID